MASRIPAITAPIARAAVPFGQSAATSVYGLISFVLMAACGLAVGWRIHRGAGYALAALVLLIAFQFAATWIGMYLGLIIPHLKARRPAGPAVSHVLRRAADHTYRRAVPAGVCNDVGGSAKTPARLAVPHGEQLVGLVDHDLAGLHVRLRR